MTLQFSITLALLYCCGALATYGFLLRNGRSGWQRRFLQAIAALFWPAYWLVFCKISDLYGHFVDHFLLSERSFTVYLIFAVFFPAYYLHKFWGGCEGNSCIFVVGKAVAWAPFWPAYVIASLI
jgi:hypothetical protein